MEESLDEMQYDRNGSKLCHDSIMLAISGILLGRFGEI